MSSREKERRDHMKFSVNLESIYQELPFYDRFERAKRDGFDCVEIWNWENKDLVKVRQLLDLHELTLTGMGGDGPYSMCDPQHQKPYLAYLEQSITAAKQLNCKRLLVHSNALKLEPPHYAADLLPQYSHTVKTLSMFRNLMQMASLAETEGIIFCLEALNGVRDHVGNFLTTTQHAAEICSMVDSTGIRIIYDAYHMFLTEGKICETLEKYLDLIDYIHIADCPGRHEPGTGVINYRNVLQHLQHIGYDGVVAFELFPKEDSETAICAIKEVICGL